MTRVCPGILATASPADEIAALRARPGGMIGLSGGPTFARSLLREGLVDQVQLVALGEGLPPLR